MMAMMQNDAQPLLRRYERRQANEENHASDDPIPAAQTAERQQHRDEQAADGVDPAHASHEEDARLVAVADGVTDEVWVGLPAQDGLDHGGEDGEGGGVRRVLEGVEGGGAIPMGKVELARRGRGNVVGYDLVDFGTERLDGDYA